MIAPPPVAPVDAAHSPTWVQRRLLGAVDLYQRAREGRPSPCRFHPTCSSYARESLEQHGATRGTWLTVRRLLRCRPFGPSGFDPVPTADDDRSERMSRHHTVTVPVAVQKG
ncbi:MAG: membrane protein insertion efficiency factor YidD [Acidimicrobiia bacterium]|nr:membrane protein insertion efficiency factor YidD [Acidimicrobiia bacterium]